MKHLIKILIIIFISTLSISAQESELLIGEWKNYYPYKYAIQVTQNDNEVYFASSLSILIYEKSGNVKGFISRIEGLNDIDFGPIKYTPYKNTLIITYANGNIDFYRGKQDVLNINDLKSNSNIIGRRSINHLYLQNDSTAILSADFGVTILDIAKEEFKVSIFTNNNKVLSTASYKDTLFVSTEAGIFKVPKNVNIQDYSKWIPFNVNGSTNFKGGQSIVYQDALYFTKNDTLLNYQNGKTEFIYFKKNYKVNYLSAEGKHLITGMFCTSSAGCIGFGLIIDENGQQEEVVNSCFNRPVSAVEDKNNIVWVGDEWDYYKHYNIDSKECDAGFQINSPNSEKSFEILVYGDKTYITSGGLKNGASYNYDGSGFYIYDNTKKEWTNINSSNTPIIAQTLSLDLLRIARSPKNGHIFIGSFLGGLLEWDGSTVNIYDKNNSGLTAPSGDTQRSRVSGLAFDSKQNLWIANHGADKPIVVFTKDGEWKNFVAGDNKNLYQLVIDEYDNKWYSLGTSGVFVYNEGDDLNNTSDDLKKEINQSNSNLPSNTVNCLAVDLNGDVWVGTNQGPVVFECDDIFNSPNCKGTKRIVQQDGFGAFLLETENIRVIAVDGANRKWFGTDNGVFVQSPDAETQIYHFDTKNSPLSSNSITAIDFNDENGEVWIGTEKGFSVYRMGVTAGTNQFASMVFAFPNPVRPDYTGPIVISGLANNSNVKITDTNGKLVYETTSEGGQAIWNGADYTGRRANSGVYLVFATSTYDIENPTAIVAKIVLVN